MKRFSCLDPFQAWHADDRVFFEGSQHITLRAEKPCALYGANNPDFTDEVLIGMGDGEFQVDTPPTTFVRTESKGRVWLAVKIRNQSIESGDESFTTLDRPEPLSPEMRLISQMMRRNEMERENDRREMARIREERSQSNPDAQTTSESKTTQKKKVRDEPEPSSSDAKKSKGKGDNPVPDTTGTPDPSADTDESTADSDG